MKNRSYYLLFFLLITTINLYASDYSAAFGGHDSDYYEDYENTYDDDDENADWFSTGDILENSQLPLLVKSKHSVEQIFILFDYLTSNTQDDSPIKNELLHIAIKHRHVPLVEELLRRNADVNFRFKGQTPLLVAIRPLANDNFGWKDETPLLVAESLEDMIIAQKLIQHGADVNATDIFGETPLYCACRQGHTETVKFLLAYKADATIKRSFDLTPAQVATLKGFTKIADLINNWEDLPEYKEPDVE